MLRECKSNQQPVELLKLKNGCHLNELLNLFSHFHDKTNTIKT
jgi:hypothetical protein